jgi:hypothetical protein
MTHYIWRGAAATGFFFAMTLYSWRGSGRKQPEIERGEIANE